MFHHFILIDIPCLTGGARQLWDDRWTLDFRGFEKRGSGSTFLAAQLVDCAGCYIVQRLPA